MFDMMGAEGSIQVYISGEDPVTKAVIRRILDFVSPRFLIIDNIPARGGEIKKKIPQCNTLASAFPVIMLLDADEGCAPTLKANLLKEQKQSDKFLLNIAVDEAEAWLMADIDGFAGYFGIDVRDMPKANLTKQGGRKAVVEMEFAMKSSYVFTHQLILKSTKPDFVKQIGVRELGRTKGKEYNAAVIPFIMNIWDIDKAKENSDSLQRMLRRINELISSY